MELEEFKKLKIVFLRNQEERSAENRAIQMPDALDGEFQLFTYKNDVLAVKTNDLSLEDEEFFGGKCNESHVSHFSIANKTLH